MQTCGMQWSELQAKGDSVQFYRGQLPGMHAGVALTFALRVGRPPTGWQYLLNGIAAGRLVRVPHYLPEAG